MNIHHAKPLLPLQQSAAPVPSHALPTLDGSRLARRLVIFTPTAKVIRELLAQASSAIHGLANPKVVERVANYNPDAFWAIARKSTYDVSNPSADGLLAFLFLNDAGMEALANNTLNRSDPPLEFLAAQSEKPAAIYVWHIHARGPIAAGIALVFEKVSTPQYRDVDIFTRPITAEGKRITDSVGFVENAEWKGNATPHLHYFPRSQNALARSQPRYDRKVSGRASDEIGITVVRTMEDFIKVISVRTDVYMTEQSCPFEEEFDGNDFSGNHLLAYIGGEPIGCLRIRFFADFAKLERVAIRSKFRNSRAAHDLIRAAVEFIRMKGYTQIYGQIQKRLVPFWARYGFKEFAGANTFSFSDYDYVEMIMEVEPHPGAVRIGTNPYIAIRPEGLWHKPGVLEKSVTRTSHA